MNEFFSDFSSPEQMDEVAVQEPADDWISVEERLPEYKARAGSDSFVTVIVCLKGRLVGEGVFCSGVWETLGVKGAPVTHWMPLPDPPKAKK